MESSSVRALLGLLTVSGILLVACSSLPDDAEQSVLDQFHIEEQPHIHSVHSGELLLEDSEIGAEEVWCVHVSHLCYDCGRQQLSSCVTPYLARLVNGAWWVDSVVAEEDLELWELRGCPVLSEAGPPPPASAP